MSFTGYRRPQLELAPRLQKPKSAFAFWVACGIVGGIVLAFYLAGVFNVD